MVEHVLGTFGEWYLTLWDKISVDQLLEQTKALAKDSKAINKAVRLYDVYKCDPSQKSISICALHAVFGLQGTLARGVAVWYTSGLLGSLVEVRQDTEWTTLTHVKEHKE